MKRKTIGVVFLILVAAIAVGAMSGIQTNFTRLVLGDDNFGTDPNPTADITGQNDEYISNATDGTWDFGAANILTTGTITGGGIVLNSFSLASSVATSLNGFVVTNSDVNTTRSTIAGTRDTSAIYFYTTGTGKPVFGITNAAGTGVLTYDSAGVWKIVLGSDAAGDMFYRAVTTGAFTRLALGTSTQYLGVGSNAPAWKTPNQGFFLSDTTKFPLLTSLRDGAYLSDTTKFPLLTSLRQGAYLSDTTKYATVASPTLTGTATVAKVKFTNATIDSAVVDTDTLRLYVGGVQYLCPKR